MNHSTAKNRSADSRGEINPDSSSRYYGKYRGKVENNIDPLMMGRVQASCPAILGDAMLAWAMPCSPYAGPGVGFFAVPPMGANIWVEFEGGDVDYPIYSGCFWGLGEAPLPAATMPLGAMKVFKTECLELILDDMPGIGGFTLKVDPPAVAMPLKMVFDSQGIEISGTPASIKITPAEIELSHMPASAKVSPAGVELDSAPSSVKVGPAAVEIASAPAEVKVAAAAVEIKNAAAEAKIAASGIEIKNGAASVELTPASVNINKGALEVI